MWDELGISAGTALMVLIALYFMIKWAVKSGVKQALEERDEECGRKMPDREDGP